MVDESGATQGEELTEDLLDLNEVMQAFGVEEWKNLGLVQDINMLVEIQGERYVLRERVESMLEEDLSHRYAFRRYLQQAGIPVPELWQTPQGESSAKIGDDYFELQQWVDGEQFSTDDARSLNWTAAAGTMLGHIHQSSLQYPGHQHRWPSEAHMGGMVQSWLNLARSRIETCEIQAIASALSDWVEQCEAVLPAAMVAIGSGGALPEFHIHGDYHALNLRFRSNGVHEVAAVMGWEASRWEKRIFEVAYALFSFSALTWKPGEPLTRPLVKRGFEPERARRFLAAYGAISPPSRGEADLLADALTIIAPIVTINGPLEDLFYSQEDLNETLIEDMMERLSWAIAMPAWLRRVRSSLAEMWSQVGFSPVKR